MRTAFLSAGGRATSKQVAALNSDKRAPRVEGRENYFNFTQNYLLTFFYGENCICRIVSSETVAQIIHTTHIGFISAAFKIMDCKDKSDNNCRVIDDSPVCCE